MEDILYAQIEFAIEKHEGCMLREEIDKAAAWYLEIARLRTLLAKIYSEKPDPQYRAHGEQDDNQIYDQRPGGW